MDMSLGTFGDLRLDKRGVRSSNRWSHARLCVCAVWVVTAVASFRLGGFSPARKPAPA
jgi:hypothetical protein